ncbi:hypothetical protein BH20ACT15_BH20ACT15_02430 [soil metagenome]
MIDLPLPRAWIGRERLMLRILDARLATELDDAHHELLSELFVSCFSVREFPSADDLAEAAAEMCVVIRTQAFGDASIPDDPDGRRKRIVALLRAAVREREALP